MKSLDRIAVLLFISVVAATIRSPTDHGDPLFPAPDTDIILIRTDLSGKLIFGRIYQLQGLDRCIAAIGTQNGGFAIAGYGKEDGKRWSSGLLIVTDSIGNDLWCRYYNPDSTAHVNRCSSILQFRDGSFLLAGFSGYTDRKVWLLCVSERGEPIWSQVYPADLGKFCNPIISAKDDGFILASHIRDEDSTNASDGSMWADDALTLKIDREGQQRWLRGQGTNQSCLFESVVATSDRGYIIVGHAPEIVNMNSRGDLVSQKPIKLDQHTSFNTILRTPDSGYVISGVVYNSNSSSLCLVKLDAEGDSVWSRTYADRGGVNECDVTVAQDGGYVLAGSIFNESTYQHEGYFVKTDTTGRQEWVWSYACGRSVSLVLVLSVPGGYILAGSVREPCAESDLVATPR